MFWLMYASSRGPTHAASRCRRADCSCHLHHHARLRPQVVPAIQAGELADRLDRLLTLTPFEQWRRACAAPCVVGRSRPARSRRRRHAHSGGYTALSRGTLRSRDQKLSCCSDRRFTRVDESFRRGTARIGWTRPAWSSNVAIVASVALSPGSDGGGVPRSRRRCTSPQQPVSGCSTCSTNSRYTAGGSTRVGTRHGRIRGGSYLKLRSAGLVHGNIGAHVHHLGPHSELCAQALPRGQPVVS